MIALRRMNAPAGGLLAAALATGMAVVFAGTAWAGETFGVERFETSIAANMEGVSATQAGSHPYALTTAITFNHVVTAVEEPPRVRTYGDPKDIEVNLPQGMIINPRATGARCTEAELESGQESTGCPNTAAVGVFSVYLDGIEILGEPVYNMATPAGVPAELGFDAAGIGLIMHVGGRVRTGSDYGMSADIFDMPDEHRIYGLDLTLWGDPSAASHDEERGLCADEKAKQSFKKTGIRESCPVERTGAPFLTLPTSCTGEPLITTLSVDSWQEPGATNSDGTPDLSDPRWRTADSSSPPVTGCEALQFNPTLAVQPAPEPTAGPKPTADSAPAPAESPTGLNVDLKIPHEENTADLAGADLRQLAVALPPGMAISLSAANGLGACADAPEPGRPEGEIALGSDEPAHCPESSKIGEATVVTPLLEQPLTGAVYLAQQDTFESALIGLYVVVEGDGVLVKLAGRANLDPSTGQITIAFADIPQLPVGEIELSLYGGPRAALVTPPGCGAYTTTSQLTPWSGAPPATPSSRFTVGSNCAQGFAPSFIAGTTDARAGASSPFTIAVTRQNGEQHLSGLRVVAPPGLVGVLKDVPPCPEPQASTGQCPGASEVGEASIAAGPGADPVWIAGHIYLTGSYAGAPFGLSIVIPAAAGPFDLGTVLVRARIEVDSHTAQLIVTSDPLPTILAGVPLDIRTIELTLARPGFIVNPTSCAPLSVSGTISSTAGAGLPVSSPFAAVDCASLPFTPRLTASTQAHTTRSRGASLSVRIAAHPGQANIAKVRLILPWQLPGRLRTLQHACTPGIFDANPAACPAASIVGTATAVTPLLAHPLSGPAYLLARSGATFPDLALVLQGEGIVLYLDGNTDIKHGLTSATFNSIPDLPIATFAASFPEGPHSILGADLPARAHGSMCGQSPIMPVALTAQNGAVRAQTAHVAVTGCPKHRGRGRRQKRTDRARARKWRRRR